MLTANPEEAADLVAGGNSDLTLLESAFPALAVPKVVAADRRKNDPAYAAHRWWARRPPAVLRSILLAASLPSGTSHEEFWRLYGSEEQFLTGVSAHDPFMGGGTTLIEAARLGASVSGTDVDATSRQIVAHALEPPQAGEVAEAGESLLGFLRLSFSSLYPSDRGEPLHYFWLPIVTCPKCDTSGPLYRSLVLSRDAGKPGAVVRDFGMAVFDPETLKVHHLASPDRRMLTTANGRRVRIDTGTFKSRKYVCPECGSRSSHRELGTGQAPRLLLAVERTPQDRRRAFDSPTHHDVAAVELASQQLDNPPVEIVVPAVEFDPERADPRPRSYGIDAVRDLFTARQLLVLGAAHAWLDASGLDAPIDRALRLALSNSLMTNNRLCSYATDYGRLSALFSVRGYSLPAQSVELNPLHTRGGRGTLQQCINRVVRSSSAVVRRSIWNPGQDSVSSKKFAFERTSQTGDLGCSSAADHSPISPVDLLVFDPPYYDYIVYDELAELFRSWNPKLSLGGQPLQSSADGDPEAFGTRLADCLRPALRARRAGRPIAFTYHSSNPSAWQAIGIALDEAKLRVTALWPVRSDGHMGHHSHPGNCEWDVVVVCRPIDETRTAPVPNGYGSWEHLFGDLPVSAADGRNFKEALSMASPRLG
ncbi:MAG: hypothetical protein OXK79_05120, partial [Chloroflexota bacterium]|nr:hypothetical protein [Chloroflexota bacterium]